MARTTMGKLADWSPPPEEANFYRNIVQLIDVVYPKDWREWVVNELEYEDLFGESISPDVECRLRFALPTVALARAYEDQNDNPPLSERRYKHIKRMLLSWPLGRALIYAPLSIMAKIHPVEAYNKFGDTIAAIKNSLISRQEAVKVLKPDTSDIIDVESVPSIPAATKRAHSPEPTEGAKEPKLSDFIALQHSMFVKLCQMVQTSNENMNSVLQNANKGTPHLPHQCSPSPQDSQSSEQDEYESNNETNNWSAPPIVDEIVSEEEQDEEDLVNFSPETKESEAKITKADDIFVKQGVTCQRFNSEGWQNIRYAEVQKLFQASPAFTSLKVNSNLATVTPSWNMVTLLEKMDLCLGAITHGLLKQREAFQNVYKQAPPNVKSYISKHILTVDAPFRKISDSLLQYTCGKRAETIQQRRAIYKPANKTLNELLHAIPPSEHHLFAEPQLSELVKEQGGVTKLFLGSFGSLPTIPAANINRDRDAYKRAPAGTSFETKYRPNRNSTTRKAERRDLTQSAAP
ncbi:hypothetical protein NE865_03115 [Phthorimaea operculella]|nr:hypothetical protein NE865_03115 [Phthorimaea operculella]